MSEQSPLLSPLMNRQNDSQPAGIPFRGVKVAELAFLSHFNLRLQQSDPKADLAVKSLLGVELPTEPNTFDIFDNLLCAWLGPDEWLMMTPQEQPELMCQQLREELRDAFAIVHDMTSAQTIIRLTGSKITEFLGRGISYDLHPRVFKPGQCVQCVMARVPVIVLCHTATERTIDLVVRRSYADYLWNWLLDVGNEADFSQSKSA